MKKISLLLLLFCIWIQNLEAQKLLSLTTLTLKYPQGFKNQNSDNRFLVKIHVKYEHIPNVCNGNASIPNVTPTIIGDQDFELYFDRLGSNYRSNSSTWPYPLDVVNGVQWISKINSELFCLDEDIQDLVGCQDFRVWITSFKVYDVSGTTLLFEDYNNTTVPADQWKTFIFDAGDQLAQGGTFAIGTSGFKLSYFDSQYNTDIVLDYKLYENATATQPLEPFEDKDTKFNCPNNKDDFYQRKNYGSCRFDNAAPFKLTVTSNENNVNAPTDLGSPPSNPIHFFKLKINGVDASSSSYMPNFDSYTHSNRLSTYTLPFVYVPSDPDILSADCNDVTKFYTDYELTICEFRTCPGNGCNLCRTEFPAYDNKEATTKMIKIRIYRPLTEVSIDEKNPCEDRKIGGSKFYLDSPDSRYGHIIVDLCKRKGGFQGDYSVELCMDKEPLDNIYDPNCATCFSKNFDASNPQLINFYGLNPGQYLLTIHSLNPDFKNCGEIIEEINLQLLNDINTPFVITPNPAFICPNPNTPNIIPSVTLNASNDFSSYQWKYGCDPAATFASTSSLNVSKGQGGVYTLTATDGANCLRTAEATVVDLNLPNINYPLLDDVIQISASKYEHIATPELSSMPWEGITEINDFDKMNSYISGFSGIYRPKQTFDYLDERALDKNSTSADANINIKTTGLMDDVAMFNWSHPSYLKCADNWKLNSTITKFNLGSYGIESKDILGLYSSSLYGYNGMLPIAVSGLGKYHEIAFESFEEFNDLNINQLNNPADNFDFVKNIVGGSVLYYEEYPIRLGQNNYALVEMPFPPNCPGLPIIADVICRSMSGTPSSGCNGIKLSEGEVKDTKVTITNNPCGGNPNIVLAKFDEILVPTFLPSPNDECLQWDGILRLKKNKNYASASNAAVSFPEGEAHTGKKCMHIEGSSTVSFNHFDINMEANTEYILSMWVKTNGSNDKSEEFLKGYNMSNNIKVGIAAGSISFGGNSFFPQGAPINGWQKIDAVFKTGNLGGPLTISFNPMTNMFVDDIRLSPLNGGMQTYVYNPENYRLLATLDANNYATIYKYDDEGNLFTVQKETVEGFKTIQMNQSYIHTKP